MLWTSTHLALKIICSRNAAKIFSDIKNFPADMFLFGVRKNICTAPFLGTQELHSWSTLKANVCIFMYPSKHLLVLKTSSTRLQRNNFTSSKTFWRRLEDVLKTFSRPLARRLEDVLKTCLEDVLKTYLEDVLKTCLEDVLKTCLEDVLKTCLEDVLKACLEDVLKTCLEDVSKTCLEDALKTVWRQTK